MAGAEAGVGEAARGPPSKGTGACRARVQTRHLVAAGISWRSSLSGKLKFNPRGSHGGPVATPVLAPRRIERLLLDRRLRLL
eukprot:3932630-Rhodomonas_salina.1